MTAEIQFDEAAFWKWLSEQPGGREFFYHNTKGCLFASFAKESMGFLEPSCGGVSLRCDETGRVSRVPTNLDFIIADLPDTFTISQARKAFKEGGLL